MMDDMSAIVEDDIMTARADHLQKYGVTRDELLEEGFSLNKSERDKSDSTVRSFIIEVNQILRNYAPLLTPDSVSKCYSHDKNCPLFPRSGDGRRARVHIAGLPCTPMSYFGAMKGVFDDKFFLVFQWAFERRTGK